MVAARAATAPAVNAPASTVARATARIPSLSLRPAVEELRRQPFRRGDPVSGDQCPDRGGKTLSAPSDRVSRTLRMTLARPVSGGRRAGPRGDRGRGPVAGRAGGRRFRSTGSG
ncbi:hypothetical protein GCM10010402_07580 [Actinomadura luteofluorescens]